MIIVPISVITVCCVEHIDIGDKWPATKCQDHGQNYMRFQILDLWLRELLERQSFKSSVRTVMSQWTLGKPCILWDDWSTALWAQTTLNIMSIVLYFLKASKFLAEIECFHYLNPELHLQSDTGGVMLGYLNSLSELELPRWIMGLDYGVVQILSGPAHPLTIRPQLKRLENSSCLLSRKHNVRFRFGFLIVGLYWSSAWHVNLFSHKSSK